MSEVIELASYRTNLDGSLPDKGGGLISYHHSVLFFKKI